MKVTRNLKVSKALPEFPILGVDPGETTGAVKLELVAPNPVRWEEAGYLLDITTYTIDWPHEAATLGDLVLDSKTIITERFELYSESLKGSDMPAAQVYGGLLMAKHWTWGEVGRGPVMYHHRSREAAAIDYAMIQQWMGVPGLTDHELDALRVVLYHLLRRKD